MWLPLRSLVHPYILLKLIFLSLLRWPQPGFILFPWEVLIGQHFKSEKG